MADRKLFVAKKEDGEKVHIDRLSSKEGKFFCPHCSSEVIPKQGSEKIWHFAHKERICSFLADKGKDAVSHHDVELVDFSENVEEVIKVEESSNYKCVNCGSVGNKEYGKKVMDKWYCKDCFQLL